MGRLYVLKYSFFDFRKIKAVCKRALKTLQERPEKQFELNLSALTCARQITCLAVGFAVDTEKVLASERVHSIEILS